MIRLLFEWLAALGVNETLAAFFSYCVALSLLLFVVIAGFWIGRYYIMRGLSRVMRRSQAAWIDALLRNGVLDKLAFLVPGVLIYLLAGLLFVPGTAWARMLSSASLIYLIVAAFWLLNGLLNTFLDVYRQMDVERGLPITGFVQVIKLILLAIGVICIVAIIINRTALYVLGGLGALSAVLMLIFRDPILGFAAGVQLTTSNLVARGDWIEMPKYDANGEVLEVGLTTVKVQNADKSVTTIPTYSLISESFKNWRGMREAGARRIKRALIIDVSSVKFCDQSMLDRFAAIQILEDYVARKRREVAAHNRAHGIDEATVINGRRLTNVGTFRAYVEAYLRNHPLIRQDMPLLVRQLPPGADGLPIELYAYCCETEWQVYETAQADIFDHLLAAVPTFELRIFQQPTGYDVRGGASPALPR